MARAIERVTPEILEYWFRTRLRQHLKIRNLKNYQELEDGITHALMEEVPASAFEERLAHQEGYLFFTSYVDDEVCENMQHEIMSAHLTLAKNKPINLILSSYGGEVISGLALMSTIRHAQREGREVNVHISGNAASMGTIILQAGTKRTCEDFSTFMVHEEAYGMPDGTKFSTHKDYLEWIEKEEEAGYRIYAERSGRSVEFWKEICLRHDAGLSAKEALEYGLIDEIVLNPFAKKGTSPQ